MKKILLLIILIVLTQIGCKKTNESSIPTSLDGKWKMITVRDNATGLTTTKPASIKNDVEITFTSIDSTKGTFTGNTPTNEIGKSDYSIGINQTITIHDLLMTQISETSRGIEFVKNFGSSKKYNFKIGERVNFTTTSKTLTFQKQ